MDPTTLTARVARANRALARTLLASACVLLIAGTALVVVACGSPDEAGDDAPPAGGQASAARLAPADVAGDYPMTAHQGGAPLAGPAVVLAADGTYRWFDLSPYQPVSEGSFAIDGAGLTFTDSAGTVVQRARIDGDTLVIDEAGELASAGDEFTLRAGSRQ